MQNIWAEAIPGFVDDAHISAMQAHAEKPYDARHMFATVQADCGDKTDKQSGDTCETAMSKQKKKEQTIGSFNTEWKDALRILKANGMELPMPFTINRYLSSLGRSYRTLRTVVRAIPAKDRTLTNIMNMALDHVEEDDDDEAEVSTALIARLLQQGYDIKKRTHGQAFEANTNDHKPPRYDGRSCENCGNRYHQKDYCFSTGGGLSHLNKEQRGEWLRSVRQARMDGKPKPTPPPTAPAATSSTAMAAQIQDQRVELLEARHAMQMHGIYRRPSTTVVFTLMNLTVLVVYFRQPGNHEDISKITGLVYYQNHQHLRG